MWLTNVREGILRLRVENYQVYVRVGLAILIPESCGNEGLSFCISIVLVQAYLCHSDQLQYTLIGVWNASVTCSGFTNRAEKQTINKFASPVM